MKDVLVLWAGCTVEAPRIWGTGWRPWLGPNFCNVW